MPSHIFTRLGYWQESIDTNRRSAEAGQAYAKAEWGEGVGWDQSLHAMDYTVYAYLQLGEDRKARTVVDTAMVRELRAAADLEDSMDKHPVPPGNIVPLRELLGDLLLETGQPGSALAEYKRSLAGAPNRYRALYGAAKAADAAGDHAAARDYFQQFARLAGNANAARPELGEATAYLQREAGQ
jgi:tetratricopeptide (TPR) repeat protein